MLKHRCPWCGEWLPGYELHLDLISKLVELKDPPSCHNCKNVYMLHGISKQHFLKVEIKVIIFGVLLAVAVCFWTSIKKDINMLWGLFLIMGILFVISEIILFKQVPFERLYNRKDNSIFSFLRKQKVSVNIQWISKKSSGLWRPQLQVQDGEIFPAYFKDTEGNLISSGLCVVLEEIKWTGKRQCNCEISFVRDDISAERYFQKGNHLYLYYYDRQIAEGIVL